MTGSTQSSNQSITEATRAGGSADTCLHHLLAFRPGSTQVSSLLQASLPSAHSFPEQLKMCYLHQQLISVRLFATPWTRAHQAAVHGIL